MLDLSSRLEPRLGGEARAWLTDAQASVARSGASSLPMLLPQLARRLGRERLGGGRVRSGEAEVDLDAWRVCDAGGFTLVALARAEPALLVDLYRHGDMEERTIVLRSLGLLPVTAATAVLLGEVQRTNTLVHVEAGALDSNLVVRALAAGAGAAGFAEADFQRLLLKVAFVDLPAWRMFGALGKASPALTEMLQGFATEREAAGRSVWIDTYRFIGRAPAAGTAARLLGGIEHGDDRVRLAAAEGLVALHRKDLAPFARERLAREPREAVARLLGEAAAL
jgi:hypothetical protein